MTGASRGIGRPCRWRLAWPRAFPLAAGTPLLAAEGHAEEDNERKRFARRVIFACTSLVLACGGCTACCTFSNVFFVTPSLDDTTGSHLAGLRSAASTLLTEPPPCGHRLDRQFGLPHLEVMEGPPAPSRQLSWIARICTKFYPGPHCATPVDWKGTVTLCLDGELIPNVQLETRGHVSKLFPKQQYKMSLPMPRSLLGMAKSRHWVLAMSYVDTSFQRNPLAFHLYRMLGGWAPHTKFVTLSWGGFWPLLHLRKD